MKIYIQELNIYGCLIAFADSEEEARKLMRNEENYNINELLIENEIIKGLVFVNLGDL